jgi:hypothetical protein
MRLVESSRRSSLTDASRSTGTRSACLFSGSGSPANTTRTCGPRSTTTVRFATRPPSARLTAGVTFAS